MCVQPTRGFEGHLVIAEGKDARERRLGPVSQRGCQWKIDKLQSMCLSSTCQLSNKEIASSNTHHICCQYTSREQQDVVLRHRDSNETCTTPIRSLHKTVMMHEIFESVELSDAILAHLNMAEIVNFAHGSKEIRVVAKRYTTGLVQLLVRPYFIGEGQHTN